MTSAPRRQRVVVPTKIRLTQKLAQKLNGIDLSGIRAGDDIEVSQRDAEILIAEGWAVAIAEAHDREARRPRRRRKES